MADVNRRAFDEAIVNMTINSSKYAKDYMFYLYILSQCKVVFDDELPSPAGVAFCNDHYKLFINTKNVIYSGKDEEGNDIEVNGFSTKMPLAHRIGIIKHEMLHIIYNHVGRKEDRNHDAFNYATDCALNQDINRNHLPKFAIYPDNFPVSHGIAVPTFKSSEFYYELLNDEMKKRKNKKGKGNCKGNSTGPGSNGEGKGEDEGNTTRGYINHDTWEKSEGDEGIKKELAKKMVEKAAEETQKSTGNLPSNYSSMINGLTENREVNWKQVLRWVVGNKKVNSRRTLMRRDRRLPDCNWIKGKVKDRVFDLAVISDVSGSVSDKALVKLWSTIINICNIYKTPVTMVQIDTEPSDPEKLTKTSTIIERKRCGGTVLSPAIEKLKEHKINFDALVVTTDGFLFYDDIDPFEKLGIPVIWLIEKDGKIMDQMTSGKMRAIQLKE